jgi:hypothetical protein
MGAYNATFSMGAYHVGHAPFTSTKYLTLENSRNHIFKFIIIHTTCVPMYSSIVYTYIDLHSLLLLLYKLNIQNLIFHTLSSGPLLNLKTLG